MIGVSTIKDAPSSTVDVLVVVTRAQAKQKLAEEIIRRETEVLTGAQPSSMDGLGQEDLVVVNPISTQAPEIPATLSQDQRRSLRRQMGKDTNHTHSKSKGKCETLELSSGELQRLQENDSTLAKAFEAADSKDKIERIGFLKEKGYFIESGPHQARGTNKRLNNWFYQNRFCEGHSTS